MLSLLLHAHTKLNGWKVYSWEKYEKNKPVATTLRSPTSSARWLHLEAHMIMTLESLFGKLIHKRSFPAFDIRRTQRRRRTISRWYVLLTFQNLLWFHRLFLSFPFCFMNQSNVFQFQFVEPQRLCLLVNNSRAMFLITDIKSASAISVTLISYFHLHCENSPFSSA